MSNVSTEFQQQVKDLLHDPEVSLCITFEKSDGTWREMRCTLADDLIPEEKRPKGTGRSSSEATQRVFDRDIQEWRSFRWDSVKEYFIL